MRLNANAHFHKQLYKWFMRRTTPVGVRRVGDLPVAIGSDIGNVRDENQDRVAVLKVQLEYRNEFFVFAVCDGMGGMVDGAACASQALATFFASCIRHRLLSPVSRLHLASQDANRVVHSLYKGDGGATLSAIIIDSSGTLTGVNVGDSRIYSYVEPRLEQVSVDDTMAGLRPNLHHGNELLQYIGIGDGLEPHILNLKLPSNSLVVLSTDGAHFLDKGTFASLIQNTKDPALAVRRVIDVAKWCGGRDNASIVIGAVHALRNYSDDNYGFVQVSDPFGELQVVIDFDELDNKMQKLRSNIKPTRQEGSDLFNQLPKSNKRKRSLKKNIDKSAIETENNGKHADKPQLNIYFDSTSKKDDENA